MRERVATPGQRLYTPWLWNLIFALPFVTVFAATRFDYPLHGDEVTFYPITQQFGAHLLPPLDLLRSYEQLQTPLMFWVFGFLGRIVGADLWKYRAGVAILSYVTLLLFFRLCRSYCHGAESWLPIYTTAALGLSPYYLGASFYYYTDIPCLFALMVALTFYLADQPLAGAIAAGVAVLIRQFSLFLPGAYILSWLAKARRTSRLNLRQGAALLLPIGMLLPLIVLWGGLSPQNRLRGMVHQVGSFHPEFVNYLVLATGAYALPLALIRIRAIFQWQRLIAVAVLAPLFWFAIPRPNSPLLNLPVRTLGYLDITLTKAFGDHKTIPYFLLWYLGCLILYEVFSLEWGTLDKLIPLAVVTFFVINLFAHMVWDKYLLLVLPLILLALARGYAKSATTPEALHGWRIASFQSPK
jgi:hypothetical protein